MNTEIRRFGSGGDGNKKGMEISGST